MNIFFNTFYFCIFFLKGRGPAGRAGPKAGRGLFGDPYFRPLNRMLMGAFSLLVEEATYCSHHDQTLVTVFRYYYLSLSCVQISHSRTLQSQLFFHFCFAVKNIELYYSAVQSYNYHFASDFLFFFCSRSFWN